MRIIILLSFLLSLFVSCENQPTQDLSQLFESVIPKSLLEFAKPIPRASVLNNFKERDKSGELTVAVIDTGVDYTHEALENRMDYRFSQDGHSVRVGSDILGNSKIAHPKFFDAKIFSFGAEEISDTGKINYPKNDPAKYLETLNSDFMTVVLKHLKNAKDSKGKGKNVPKEWKKIYLKLSDSIFPDKITTESFSLFSYLFLKKQFDIMKKQGVLENFEMIKNILSLSVKEKEMLAKSIRGRDYNILSEQSKSGKGGLLGLMKLILKKQVPDFFKSWGFYRNYFERDWRLATSFPLPSFTPESLLKLSTKKGSSIEEILKELQSQEGQESSPASEAFMAFFISQNSEYFMELLEKVYTEFLTDHSYNEDFEKYKKFHLIQNQVAKDENRTEEDDKMLDLELTLQLYSLWFKHHTNYKTLDPLYILSEEVCFSLTPEDYNSIFDEKKSSQSIRTNIIESYISQNLEDLHRVLTSEEAENVLPKTFIKMEDNVKMYEKHFKSLMMNYLQDRNFEDFICNGDTIKDTKIGQKYIAFNKDVHNIYGTGSVGESHGTHVSGIIAKQDPKIRIYPIRVINSPHSNPSSIEDEVLKNLLGEFQNWLTENPYIRRYIASLYSKELGIDETTSPEDFVKIVLRRFSRELIKNDELKGKIIFEGTFVSHLSQAIKVVGDNRIKVANISMGTGENLNVTPTSERGLHKVSEIVEYLFGHFFKYHLAKSIDQFARDTIFVVASGNDGSWYDGYSRSNFPCQLDTKEFDDFVKEGEPQVLNNSIKNIVCIASINAKKDYSSFTNLPITDNGMFLYAAGESILAPVIRNDCESVNQIFNSRYPLELDYPMLGGKNSNLSRIVFSLILEKGNLPNTELDILIRDFAAKNQDGNPETVLLDFDSIPREYLKNKMSPIEQSTQRYLHLVESFKQHACIVDHYYYAKLSGTSMASPLAAGRIAHFLISEMEKSQIFDQNQVYDNGQFSPEVVIQKLKEELPSLNCDGKKDQKCILWDENNLYQGYPLKGFLVP